MAYCFMAPICVARVSIYVSFPIVNLIFGPSFWLILDFCNFASITPCSHWVTPVFSRIWSDESAHVTYLLSISWPCKKYVTRLGKRLETKNLTKCVSCIVWHCSFKTDERLFQNVSSVRQSVGHHTFFNFVNYTFMTSCISPRLTWLFILNSNLKKWTSGNIYEDIFVWFKRSNFVSFEGMGFTETWFLNGLYSRAWLGT